MYCASCGRLALVVRLRMWTRMSNLFRSPELIRAEVNRLEAEAESLRATSASNVRRLEAEAESVRATSASNVKRAVAEIRAQQYKLLLRVVAPAAMAAGLVFLGADYYVHENTAHLERRVAAALRRMQPPPDAAVAMGARLPVPGTPLGRDIGHLPAMVLGPTGCGKSTALIALAREAAMPANGEVGTPTVLIRIRISQDQTVDPSRSLDATAQAVFSQLGFPLRRAILHNLFAGQEVSVGGASVLMPTPSSGRLVDALSILFRVSEGIYHERVKSGIPPARAKPLLILDEVQAGASCLLVLDESVICCYLTLTRSLDPHAVA